MISNYNGTTLFGENVGGTQLKPVFSQLNQPNGYNDVASGDTIHLEGAVANYNAVSLTKKLVIIGPGYFLPDNPNTSNDLLEAKLDYIYFDDIVGSSSEGSQILGVHITNSPGISIYNISNITIKRCRIDYSIYVGYDNSNIFIVGNFFSNINSNTTPAINVSSVGFPASFIFNNNISQRVLALFSGSTIYVATECKNNVFDCPALSGGNYSIKMFCNNFLNNILKTPGATVDINNGVTGSGVDYNISASASGQFGTGLNNIVVANQTTLFVTSLSNDGKYQLKAASPGSGNGSDNTDRGAFGGLSPTSKYTLSGLAAIPVVYDIKTSGVADATGLPVIIKARTIQ